SQRYRRNLQRHGNARGNFVDSNLLVKEHREHINGRELIAQSFTFGTERYVYRDRYFRRWDADGYSSIQGWRDESRITCDLEWQWASDLYDIIIDRRHAQHHRRVQRRRAVRRQHRHT